jgi:hypothetical protein
MERAGGFPPAFFIFGVQHMRGTGSHLFRLGVRANVVLW